jgi:hypothetical protein
MQNLLFVALIKSYSNAGHKKLGTLGLKCFLLDQVKSEVSAGEQINDEIYIIIILESKIDVNDELRRRIRLVNLLQEG